MTKVMRRIVTLERGGLRDIVGDEEQEVEGITEVGFSVLGG
jgi:hypothetical protein